VKVDRQRLQPREPRIAFVEVTPSRLCESDRGIAESAEGAPQEIGRRDEVCVEDRDERSLGEGQAVRERPCLVTAPRGAPYVGDMQSLATPHRCAQRHDRGRLVV